MPKIYFTGPDLQKQSREVVFKVCEELGLEIFPVSCSAEGTLDAHHHLIENAAFVIADVSIQETNFESLKIFYEIGYAQRAQKTIFLIAQAKTFSTAQFDVLIYNPQDFEEFYRQLLSALVALCHKEKLRYNRLPGMPEVTGGEPLAIFEKQNLLVENYVAIGDAWINARRYDEAQQEYSRALLHVGKDEPQTHHAYVFFKRGFACKKQGLIQEALADYSQALELHPQYVDAYIARGLTLYELQQYQQALADFNEAGKLKPHFTRVYVLAGAMQRLLGDYDQAIAKLNTAIELNPYYPDAFFTRGVVYVDCQDYDHALRDFAQAIELNPHYSDAFLQRGLVYTTIKNYDSAIEDFNKVIELNPHSVDAYSHRAQALFEKGYREYHQLAIEDWQKAIELGASNARQLEDKIKSTSRSIG